MKETILLLAIFLIAKYLPKPKLLRRKPFTCPLCLTFWSFLIYKSVYYTCLFDLIFLPLAMALISAWLEQANDKLFLI